MTIEISSYRPATKVGFCQGYCSFTVKTYFMYFNDVAIYLKDGQRWLQFPSRKYEMDGKTKYLSYAGFTSPEIKKKFEDKFFVQLDKYISENPASGAKQKAPPVEDDTCPF